MRDPKRIDHVLNELEKYWKANPDLRLGQIISNMTTALGRIDCFHIEDDDMVKAIKHFTKDLENKSIEPKVIKETATEDLSKIEKEIITIYHGDDVCVGEVLASTGVNNISLEDAMKLYCKIMHIVEKDTFVQFYNESPCLGNNDYRIIGGEDYESNATF